MSTMTSDLVRPADGPALDAAAAILRAGGLVAFPTETVYGLGAHARDDRAVAGIFAAKGRPQFNPLIVHFPDAASAAGEVVFDRRAEKLAAAFWPGPLTLVLPRRPKSAISRLCSAGLESLAVRVPGQPVAQKLLRLCGLPLAAPSANASGGISPTVAAHVARSLGDRVQLILDDGPTSVGLESTVVDLTGAEARLLRPGGITVSELEKHVGPLVIGSSAIGSRTQGPDGQAGTALPSPGLLQSHYAPHLPLRLAARDVAPDEALLAFGPAVPSGARVAINLSPSGDLTEAAARLFAALFELDQAPCRGIAAMPIPDHGLGLAINDRLRRAAAPRPSRLEETKVQNKVSTGEGV